MEYRMLGKSDLRISAIGFGCMSLEKVPDASQGLLQKAIDYGINFFDTADLYQKGLNEVWVGEAIKPIRKSIVLATKVGNQLKPDKSGWDWNPTKNYILQAVDKSLERLQTDYIDLYQLHGGTIADPIDETIEAFELLKEQGKIRYYGISSIRPNVIREYVRRSSMVSVMMQYSLLDRRPDETCLGLLAENQIGVLARGSLAQGLLAGKPAKEYLGYSQEQVTRVQKGLERLVDKSRSQAQVALQYVLQHPFITAPVVGISSLDQLKEIMDALSINGITKEERNMLSALLTANQYEQHR